MSGVCVLPLVHRALNLQSLLLHKALVAIHWLLGDLASYSYKFLSMLVDLSDWLHLHES